MDTFLPLIPVFVLGAMGPGPSLAVVLRNSIAGGRRQGVLTAVGHGIGFGLYAFVATLGLAGAVAANETFAEFVRWAGVALLIYLGFAYLRSSLKHQSDTGEALDLTVQGRAGFAQGFLIAFLNPKILAWLIAILTPVIDTDVAVPVLLGVAAMGLFIDMGWYAVVALLATSSNFAERLRAAASRIDLGLAVLMLVLAGLLAFDVI